MHQIFESIYTSRSHSFLNIRGSWCAEFADQPDFSSATENFSTQNRDDGKYSLCTSNAYFVHQSQIMPQFLEAFLNIPLIPTSAFFAKRPASSHLSISPNTYPLFSLSKTSSSHSILVILSNTPIPISSTCFNATNPSVPMPSQEKLVERAFLERCDSIG